MKTFPTTYLSPAWTCLSCKVCLSCSTHFPASTVNIHILYSHMARWKQALWTLIFSLIFHSWKWNCLMVKVVSFCFRSSKMLSSVQSIWFFRSPPCLNTFWSSAQIHPCWPFRMLSEWCRVFSCSFFKSRSKLWCFRFLQDPHVAWTAWRFRWKSCQSSTNFSTYDKGLQIEGSFHVYTWRQCHRCPISFFWDLCCFFSPFQCTRQAFSLHIWTCPSSKWWLGRLLYHSHTFHTFKCSSCWS